MCPCVRRTSADFNFQEVFTVAADKDPRMATTLALFWEVVGAFEPLKKR
jgi:hypothetical protein